MIWYHSLARQLDTTIQVQTGMYGLSYQPSGTLQLSFRRDFFGVYLCHARSSLGLGPAVNFQHKRSYSVLNLQTRSDQLSMHSSHFALTDLTHQM